MDSEDKSFTIIMCALFIFGAFALWFFSASKQSQERTRQEAFKAGLVEKKQLDGSVIFVKPEEKK